MEVLSNVKRRQFRSQSEILELLKEQQQSGISVRAFCAERIIPEGSFHNWKKRYIAADEAADRKGFAQVELAAAAASVFAEVNGIKLYQPVSAAYLKELVS